MERSIYKRELITTKATVATAHNKGRKAGGGRRPPSHQALHRR